MKTPAAKTTSKGTLRRCPCGYEFSHSTPIRKRQFESFAVVSDRDYQRFLRAEGRVLRAVGVLVKLRAIARSSELVGLLLECPDCGRLMLMKPGGSSKAFYLKEESA